MSLSYTNILQSIIIIIPQFCIFLSYPSILHHFFNSVPLMFLISTSSCISSTHILLGLRLVYLPCTFVSLYSFCDSFTIHISKSPLLIFHYLIWYGPNLKLLFKYLIFYSIPSCFDLYFSYESHFCGIYS